MDQLFQTATAKLEGTTDDESDTESTTSGESQCTSSSTTNSASSTSESNPRCWPLGCGSKDGDPPYQAKGGWIPNLCQCGDIEANPGPEMGKGGNKAPRSNSHGPQPRGKDGKPTYFDDPEDPFMQSPQQRKGRPREITGQSPETMKRRSTSQASPQTVPVRLDFQTPTPVSMKPGLTDELAEVCQGKTSLGPIGIGKLPTGRTFLHIPQLDYESVRCLENHLQVEFDVVTHGDGQTVIPANARVLSVVQHAKVASEDLVNHHILLNPPARLPYTDNPPLLSLKSWAKLLLTVLKSNGHNTTITLILPGKRLASDPREMVLMYPLFDWAPLRKFLVRRGAWLNPSMVLLQTDGTHVKVMPGTMAFWHFSASANFSTLDDPVILQTPVIHGFTIQPQAKHLRRHAILTGPSTIRGTSGRAHTMSASRWLMLLNNISLDEASSCVGHSSTLKYSMACLPSVQWPNMCPEHRSIAHVMIPQDRVEELVEDVRDLDDVHLFIIDPTKFRHLYIVSHWPARRPKAQEGGGQQATVKFQADAIMDSLRSCGLENQLGPMIEYSKWDVLVYVNQPEQSELIAGKIRNWDNLVMRSLHQQQLVRTGREKALQHPPRLWLQFPAALDPLFLIQEISTRVSIVESEPGTELGTWSVSFADADTAGIMAGCVIPCGECGSALLTTGNTEVDSNLNRQGMVEPSTPFLSRLDKVTNKPFPRLSKQALESMQGN